MSTTLSLANFRFSPTRFSTTKTSTHSIDTRADNALYVFARIQKVRAVFKPLTSLDFACRDPWYACAYVEYMPVAVAYIACVCAHVPMVG